MVPHGEVNFVTTLTIDEAVTSKLDGAITLLMDQSVKLPVTDVSTNVVISVEVVRIKGTSNRQEMTELGISRYGP